MMPRLQSVTVTDFRSIRGQVTIPLDAPVVLIHGQNGAGKTSILSAIELGLTGAVQSLGRNEVDYLSHLPHKSSNQGSVEVSVKGLDGQNRTSNLIVTNGGIKNAHLLGEDLSRFFTERCYLSQATLGRLLELYQHQDTRKSDSALTKFVKDLLGLDRLEALIDGLYPTGDIRRLRKSAPSYGEAEEDLVELEKIITRYSVELDQIEKNIVAKRIEIHQLNVALNKDHAGILTTPEEALKLFQDSQDESQLQLIARTRRDLQASSSQWILLINTTRSLERASLEQDESKSRFAFESWKNVTGKALEILHDELKKIFPDIPSPSTGNPELARSVAYGLVEKELQRCSTLLAQDAKDEARLSELSESIEQGKARNLILDSQLTESASLTKDLAQLLAQLSSHVESEDCPVCGRDYSEISGIPLRSHLADQIAALSEQAGFLQALATDKSNIIGLISTAERERNETLNRKLSSELRDQFKSRRARFEELRTTLDNMKTSTNEGVALQQKASETSRKLSEFRSSDERSTSLRFSVEEIAKGLNQPIPGISEPLEDVLKRLIEYTEILERQILQRQHLTRSARENVKIWQSSVNQKIHLTNGINPIKIRLQNLKAAKAETERRLEIAKELGRQAREARTAIVRRVFNDKLNKVWQDLFIRLAPDEPFVPAFALPDPSSGSVEAVLETLYRDGGKGGNPQAMLSAGNLNTAALTLFLSLHLSVKPILPWLIIDDPVQSMDEVHISQFAALLRTLAKQHNRQIIIAVHERPLFEYLALELSPAFQNDRLITIELGRTADGATTARYEPRIYIPDQSLAA